MSFGNELKNVKLNNLEVNISILSSQGNEIHYKDTDGYEVWYEYRYYKNGVIKEKLEWVSL